MSERGDLDARMRIMSVVWLALTFGVLAFGGVVYILLTIGGLELGSFPPEFITYIAPALLLVMVVGIFIGHHLESGITAEAGDDSKAEAYFNARIVAMSMQEGPALAVIALSLLAGTPNWAVGAAALSVYTMFLARPRRDALERILRNRVPGQEV